VFGRLRRELCQGPSTAQTHAFTPFEAQGLRVNAKEKAWACSGRDDRLLADVQRWIGLSLNPAIWEAIAATGCRRATCDATKRTREISFLTVSRSPRFSSRFLASRLALGGGA
jgi:hypothetical protein